MNQRLEMTLRNNKLLNEKNELILQDPDFFLNLLSKEFDMQDALNNKISKDIEKLKVVLDYTPCTVSWVNRDLTYAGVNKTLADLCRLPVSDFYGKQIGYFSHDKYFYNFSKNLFDLPELTIREELIGNIGDEEKRFWVIGTKFNENQQAVIMGIDVTEVKNLEHTITIMDKLSSLGEMVAGIIHEVNNPLAAIKANAQLIQKFLDMNDVQKARKLSERIDATTDRISHIIRGIKTFVRRGDADPYETTPIKQIIEDAFVICEGKFKEKEVQFFPPQLDSNIEITCNVTEIFQVFVNLMANAIDAIEKLDERWVKIFVQSENGLIKIIFVDSGSGLTESIKKNLFKAFYTTKGLGKGTGLGLALCKKIIESHGGTIHVDANQPNTTFVLTFKQNI